MTTTLQRTVPAGTFSTSPSSSAESPSSTTSPALPEIDLDACTLSGIFHKEITRWNDPRDQGAQPRIQPQPAHHPVLRRDGGSSSTGLITKYLNLADRDDNTCNTAWPSSKVSSTWDATWDEPNHVAKDNSGGIADYLEANAYSIAYLGAGHGREIGASEVSVKNAAGNYVKSRPREHPRCRGLLLGPY